jgi:hypothetical protein
MLPIQTPDPLEYSGGALSPAARAVYGQMRRVLQVLAFLIGLAVTLAGGAAWVGL